MWKLERPDLVVSRSQRPLHYQCHTARKTQKLRVREVVGPLRAHVRVQSCSHLPKPPVKVVQKMITRQNTRIAWVITVKSEAIWWMGGRVLQG